MSSLYGYHRRDFREGVLHDDHTASGEPLATAETWETPAEREATEAAIHAHYVRYVLPEQRAEAAYDALARAQRDGEYRRVSWDGNAPGWLCDVTHLTRERAHLRRLMDGVALAIRLDLITAVADPEEPQLTEDLHPLNT